MSSSLASLYGCFLIIDSHYIAKPISSFGHAWGAWRPGTQCSAPPEKNRKPLLSEFPSCET